MPTFPATSVDFFLAGLESFMIRSGQGEHRAVTLLRLAGKPDAALLQRAWEQLHANQPMLGARLKRQWRGWRLVWESSGPVPAPMIVWHAPQESGPNEAVIRDRLQGRGAEGRMTTPLSLEVFPWGAEGKHVILLTWRHGWLDGTGVNLLLENLATGGTTMPPAPATPKRAGMAALYQKARPLMLRLHAMTSAGCLSAWQRGMMMAGAPRFHLIELSAEQSSTAAARQRAMCGEFLQMPFFAAVAARALRSLHESRGWDSPEVHLHLPSQSRGRTKGMIFGNHMGTLPLFLDAGHLGTLETGVQHLLDRYREALKQDLPGASEALMTLASQMPVSGFIPMVRLTNRGQICSLFHSHTGSFLPGRNEFAGAAVENVFTIPGVSAPPGLGVFVSDFGGRITVTVAWREGAVSADELAALVRAIQADLIGGTD